MGEITALDRLRSAAESDAEFIQVATADVRQVFGEYDRSVMPTGWNNVECADDRTRAFLEALDLDGVPFIVQLESLVAFYGGKWHYDQFVVSLPEPDEEGSWVAVWTCSKGWERYAQGPITLVPEKEIVEFTQRMIDRLREEPRHD